MPAKPNSPELQSQLSNDPEMTELLELFISELPRRVASVTQAWEAREMSTLRRLAHQLKGSCAGYGYPTIGAAAGIVETHVEKGASFETITAEVNELVALCRRAMSPHASHPL